MIGYGFLFSYSYCYGVLVFYAQFISKFWNERLLGKFVVAYIL